MTLEVELKLAIAPADAPRLRRHPLLKGLKPKRSKLYGIYFDTPDFDLYKARGAFRLRREGYHWVQTVKLDRGSTAGLSMRPEYETRITGNQPDFEVLPDEARAMLTPDVIGRLAPSFVSDFQRTTWMIERPEGTVELALDLGSVRAGEAEAPVAEVELELKSGAGGVLFEVAEALLEAVPLIPEYRSKALRGYQLAGIWQDKPCKAIDAKVEPGMAAAEAWRRSLLAGLSQLGHNLNGLLHGDDPEYVHQARVAVRRMRTVLSLGRRIGLTPQAWVDELRWFMGELSPARDWDVMVQETLLAAQSGLPDAGRLDVLVEAAEARRLAAYGQVRKAVGDRRLTRLLLSMGKGLFEPVHGGPALEAWVVESLDRRRKRFVKLAKGYDRLDAPGRHRLRIAAKRLRYAGEVFSTLHRSKAEAYLALVARLQDGLGAANDVAVAHHLLNELAARNRKLAYAAGMVEGFIVGAAGASVLRMGELAAELASARPFWHRKAK